MILGMNGMAILNQRRKMSELQKKLDATARAVEPVLWKILNEIEKGSGDWVTDYENDDLCLDCNKHMWVEGYIGDNIQLCHECYVVKHTK
jgi:hypothetical protein